MNDLFEELVDAYFDLLNDESTGVPAHVAARAGKIARVKPKLHKEVTRRLRR